MQYLLDKLFINPRGHRNGKCGLSKSSINKNIKYKPTLCGCRLDQASSALTTLDRMSLPAERATNRRKARRTLWITSFVSVLVCNKIFNERVQWSGDVWGYSSKWYSKKLESLPNWKTITTKKLDTMAGKDHAWSNKVNLGDDSIFFKLKDTWK